MLRVETVTSIWAGTLELRPLNPRARVVLRNEGRGMARNHEQQVTGKVGQFTPAQPTNQGQGHGQQTAGVKTSVKVHNPPGRLLITPGGKSNFQLG